MKTLTTAFLSLTLLLTPVATVYADVWVNGYYRSNGTYVNGHYRSSPDGNPYNNWSFPGNTNPYTGVTAGGSINSYLKNYSSGSTYSSPWYSTKSIYNSSCPANSYSSGTSCKCNYGYVVKNGSCVSGNNVCMAETGLMSTYDPLSNSCKCMSGYVIGSTGTCVYKSSYTSSYAGYYSPSTASCPTNSHKSLAGGCTCDAGYKTNSKKTACVQITKKDKNDMCKESFGSKSIWDGEELNSDETPNCICKKGYRWNVGGTSCVK